VTDAGVRALAAAPALASVTLSLCDLVTGAGLRALAAAPALTLLIFGIDGFDIEPLEALFPRVKFMNRAQM
jgi:hypothetical protein